MLVTMRARSGAVSSTAHHTKRSLTETVTAVYSLPDPGKIDGKQRNRSIILVLLGRRSLLSRASTDQIQEFLLDFKTKSLIKYLTNEY